MSSINPNQLSSNYSNVMMSAASQLTQEELSNEEKFNIVAHTIVEGADVVRRVNEVAQDAQSRAKRLYNELDEARRESGRLKVEIRTIQSEMSCLSDEKEEEVNIREQLDRKLNAVTQCFLKKCEKIKEIEDSEIRRNANEKASALYRRELYQGRFAMAKLGVSATGMVMTGPSFYIPYKIMKDSILPTMSNLEISEDRKWVLERYPEVTLDEELQSKAFNLAHSYFNKLRESEANERASHYFNGYEGPRSEYFYNLYSTRSICNKASAQSKFRSLDKYLQDEIDKKIYSKSGEELLGEILDEV